MSTRTQPATKKKRDVGSVFSTTMTVVVAVGLLWWVGHVIHKRITDDPAIGGVKAVKLDGDGDRTMTLTPEMAASFGLRTVEAKASKAHPELTLVGSLFIDPTRMVRVHARFPGEVISIGQVPIDPASSAGAGDKRPLLAGDQVHKGDLLAIVWSKDVGEKKSDLVDALSKLYLDKHQLESLQRLDKGILPQRKIREAEHDFETDKIAVDRIERTLRSWRLTEADIAEVRTEAEKLHEDQKGHDPKLDKTWAEVDVKAPFDAIVMERNATTGDIVDTDLDLFKLADLTTLGVKADAYEEDLPALESMPLDQRKWTVRVEADPQTPLSGTFDTIGQIIDPNDHKAPIYGWVENPNNRFRAGQFLTASIELPSSDQEVVIPRTALIDEGTRSIVFVAADEHGTTVTQRQVAVARPSHEVVYIRCHPSQREREQGCQEILPGTWVVSSGTVELASALEDLVIGAAAAKK